MTGRALVTGAAGFVGTTLCAHLEAQGWEVVREHYNLPMVDLEK